jgi:hypothetical protein
VHNLRTNPRAHVEVATGSFDVVARELDPSEREAVISMVLMGWCVWWECLRGHGHW